MTLSGWHNLDTTLRYYSIYVYNTCHMTSKKLSGILFLMQFFVLYCLGREHNDKNDKCPVSLWL